MLHLDARTHSMALDELIKKGEDDPMSNDYKSTSLLFTLADSAFKLALVESWPILRRAMLEETEPQWRQKGTPIGDMLDFTAAEVVEIKVKDDRKVVWVNIDGICRLRACRIAELVVEEPGR